MNIHGNSNRIFNVVLVKCLGFYQILDAETVTFLGRHNVYYKVYVFLIVYECLIALMMFLNGLYYCINNITESMFYFCFMSNSLFGIYKICIILNRSKVIWDCLSITKYDFTSYGLQGRHTLDVWRNLSIKFTWMYVAFTCSVLIYYVAWPLIFSNTFISMKNNDGSSSAYRLNILNLYLFVSEETYNTYFYVFHMFEAIGVAIAVFFIVTFDTIVNTLSFALSGQLQMISTTFESFGHEFLHSPNNNIDNKIKLPNGNLKLMDLYNDLKRLTIDHQSILKKYDEFLSIFQTTILLQVFVLSNAIILLWFICLTIFIGEEFTQSMVVTSIKAGSSIPFCVYGMYMSCYVFDTLHTKKDSTTFALYSSNWTEMDMKCKKLILLTMKMNNAYQKKLQYTRTRIINMEIFYQTMRICYTVVNVLLKCKKEKLVQK